MRRVFFYLIGFVFFAGCSKNEELIGVSVETSTTIEMEEEIVEEPETFFYLKSDKDPWEDRDMIHEKAQEVLAEIISDEMGQREKAEAIYNWTKKNVRYDNYSEKGDYYRGAYEGLFLRFGDCFVFAATAKELLTMAGIPNIDVIKTTTNPSHYWNIIYVDEGWYHFDCTPRKDKSEFFMLTDEELDAYSTANGDSHIYDRSLYPEVE